MQYLKKTHASMITELDVDMFYHEYWNPFYFGGKNVKGEGHEVQKNIAGVGHNALVSASFF